MDIIGVKHKVGKRNVCELFVEVDRALMQKPDLVVGPDYGLQYLQKGKVDMTSQLSLLDAFKFASLKSPKTFLIPGTMPYLHEGTLRIVAYLIRNGKVIREFEKEDPTSSEEEFALYQGANFHGGNSSTNFFEIKGKKIAVEICRDHGRQRIDRDTHLEVILTYDQNSGFYVNTLNDGFSRHGLVVDGYKPKVDLQFYDSSTHQLSSVKGKKINNSLTSYLI